MGLTTLYVALGGAIGAALRYLWGVAVLRLVGFEALPLGVMTANIAGSFLMGAFVVLAAKQGLTHLAPFVMTGVLGGFTTFSAFSLETVALIERQETGLAALYVVLSVVLSIGALFVGMSLTRWGLT